MTNLRAYSLYLLLFLWHYSYAQRPSFIAQENHRSILTAFDISDDGSRFATSSYDNHVKVWDSETGLLIQGFAINETANALQFHSSQNYLYAGTYWKNGTSLFGLNLISNKVENLENDYSVTALLNSDSRRFQVIGHSRGFLSFFDLSQETSAYLYMDSTTNVRQLAFSPDESLLAAGSSSFGDKKSLFVFNTQTLETIFQLDSDSIQFDRIQFIDDRRIVVFSDAIVKKEYYLIDIRTNKIEKLKIDGVGLAYSAKRNALYYTKKDALYQFDLKSRSTMKTLDLPNSAGDVLFLGLNNSEDRLIIAGRTIFGIELESSSLKFVVPRKPYNFEAICFAKDGLIFNAGDGELKFMDLRTNQFKQITETSTNYGDVIGMTLSPDGKYLASVTRDSFLVVYNNQSGIHFNKKFLSNNFISLSIDPNSELLACSLDDSLFFYDLNSGNLESKSDFQLPNIEKHIMFDPSGNYLSLVAENIAVIYDYSKSTYLWLRSEMEGRIKSYSFSSDGRYFALGGYGDSIEIYECHSQRLVYTLPIYSDYVESIAFVPNSYDLIAGHSSGIIQRITNTRDGFKIDRRVYSHFSPVTQISFSEEDGLLFSSASGGRIVLSDLESLDRIAQLATFSDGTWAIVDEEGRYDAPNGGDIPHMHFVLGNEPIELSQLSERAFDPGLLQKLLGYNKEALLNTAGLDSINLYPEFDLKITENELEIQAKLRDRALGKIALYINGIERNGNLISLFEAHPKDSSIYTARIDLAEYKSYLRFEESNAIGVIGYNADNFLASRLISRDFKPDPKLKSFGSAFDRLKQEPKLYALVIGTSNYRGSDLDLKFADNDALRFSSALEQTASLLFEKKNVFVSAYTTASETLPTKAVIQKSFQDLKSKITPNDVLVVYFSGHGATYTEEGKDYFYYLTADMSSSNVSDPFVRSNFTISSHELANWISELPVERNVLILDACFSGTAVNDLLAISKSSEGSNERAIQRMKHRLGTFILTGSAPNQVSFESAKYKQSLLTYALLSAMRGERLVEDQFVDVYELFTYAAENVPKYAATIGSVQYPKIAQSAGSSFYIGKVGPEVNIEVEVVRPTLIRSQFIDSEELDDMLDLSYRADEALRNLSFKQNDLFDFSDVRSLDAAYYLRGEYLQKGENLEITCILKQDKTEIDRKLITVSKNELNRFDEELMNFVVNAIK